MITGVAADANTQVSDGTCVSVDVAASIGLGYWSSVILIGIGVGMGICTHTCIRAGVCIYISIRIGVGIGLVLVFAFCFVLDIGKQRLYWNRYQFMSGGAGIVVLLWALGRLWERSGSPTASF